MLVHLIVLIFPFLFFLDSVGLLTQLSHFDSVEVIALNPDDVVFFALHVQFEYAFVMQLTLAVCLVSE